MTPLSAIRSPVIFSDEAWDAGWRAAQRLGLAVTFEPLARPMNKRDVEEIVSAVANHGFEELYADQLLVPGTADLDNPDVMEAIRRRLKDHLAVEAIRNDCVMITLPREVIDRIEPAMIRIRLIVPVRRISS